MSVLNKVVMPRTTELQRLGIVRDIVGSESADNRTHQQPFVLRDRHWWCDQTPHERGWECSKSDREREEQGTHHAPNAVVNPRHDGRHFTTALRTRLRKRRKRRKLDLPRNDTQDHPDERWTGRST